MSAQLSRCVAVYSRHFVASRINAPAVVVAVVYSLDHFVTTQTTMAWTKSLLDRRVHRIDDCATFRTAPSMSSRTIRIRARDRGRAASAGLTSAASQPCSSLTVENAAFIIIIIIIIYYATKAAQ